MSESDRSAEQPSLAEIRARLEGASGPELWRGFDEIARTPEFERWLADEFPERESLKDVNRRDVLKLMGASLLLAGLGGCRGVFLPQERIVPYVKAPEDIVPGKPLYYATTMPHMGYGLGVLAEQHMGRPIKVDGNPDHPATLGRSNVYLLASILNMYDPDRVEAPSYLGNPTTWEDFYQAARKALAAAPNGEGLRILSTSNASPTLGRVIGELMGRYPQMRWHTYDSIDGAPAREGASAAFGQPLQPVYSFDKADVVLALDSDFLSELPGSIRYALDFSNRRRYPETAGLSRLYSLESAPTITGAKADLRARLRASEIPAAAATLAGMLAVPGVTPQAPPAAIEAGVLRDIVSDLMGARGRSIVIAGENQSAALHSLAHAMNEVLGNVGSTVRYLPSFQSTPNDTSSSIGQLISDLNSGQVGALLILGGNPAFDAPVELGFAQAARRARFTARLSPHIDESAAVCDWHLPESHYLEAWGDWYAFDGTASIQQPLIAPLYQSRSAIELLSALLGPEVAGYKLVRDTWMGRLATAGEDAEKAWRSALNLGVLPAWAAVQSLSSQPKHSFAPFALPASARGIEVLFRPDPTVLDGSYANNGWLQECPKPLTKITWENTIQVSPRTAERLGLQSEDGARLTVGGRSVEGPVWVMPGQPDGSVTVHLGYGRKRAGRIGNVGMDVQSIRTSSAMQLAEGATLERIAGIYPVASTQTHASMEGRDIVRYGSLAELKENPGLRELEEPDAVIGNLETPKASMYPENKQIVPQAEHQWAMLVDLNTCIGCNACVLGCVSENNIPVVGKTQVKRSREMHWIRVDRYYGPQNGAANLDNPATHFQPVTCMHCEKAPCEPVCPVAATVHSAEGLNQMIYNRCVGTRYCSNNCPYKVRRFNFLNYGDRDDFPWWDPARAPAPQLRLLNNPDVTVRGRGVMEKCTYCVQRINAARIEAKKENRQIRDGEVVTACQQACPANAIVFGNINDPESKVSKLRENRRNYALLAELNTRPRTTYLAKVTNPKEGGEG